MASAAAAVTSSSARHAFRRADAVPAKTTLERNGIKFELPFRSDHLFRRMILFRKVCSFSGSCSNRRAEPPRRARRPP